MLLLACDSIQGATMSIKTSLTREYTMLNTEAGLSIITDNFQEPPEMSGMDTLVWFTLAYHFSLHVITPLTRLCM